MRTLTPRQRKILRDAERKLRAANDAGPDAADGELNIVPFLDVVVNLIMFLLMTVTATLALADVPVDTPATPTGDATQRPPSEHAAPRADPPLVHLGTEGLHVFAAGQRLGPDCQTVATGGVTIPRVGGQQDWLALRRCALELAARGPGAHRDPRSAREHAAPDRRVSLSAVADAPYEDVVHAMDALRGSPVQPLFDEVRWVAAAREGTTP